jgi:hypothetical protein
MSVVFSAATCVPEWVYTFQQQFCIQLVGYSARQMKRIRSKWGISVQVGLCLLVLFLTSLDAIHSHGPANPLRSGEHCLLCMAAHLPMAVSASAAAPAPVFAAVTTLSYFHAGPARQPLNVFSLCMRPPPLV